MVVAGKILRNILPFQKNNNHYFSLTKWESFYVLTKLCKHDIIIFDELLITPNHHANIITIELIERAELVTKGIKSCKKTISFPFVTSEVERYRYMDSAGEYEAWGTYFIFKKQKFNVYEVEENIVYG